ncbi:glucose dehydrogenase [FAD, quinone] [Nasonia vitripennis]|uniref:Glucose-methanol-choline oxidoreductase N-terminal domain-containing protein n=1 Tax=Nasonia vitripennis TaxID=7425 RepID=A0A7M7ITF5_NASVI|nr:glucose dehydrogenase [FAD, quinone] [Nasonia vitripennis]
MARIREGVLVFLALGVWSAASIHYASDVPVTEYPFGTTGTVASGGCCHCRFNDTAYMNVACGRLTSFMTMLQALMMARCDISDPCRRLGTDVVPHEEWFDFIVVGAGVAGPVIAKRLSDYRWWRVLLVEAGPEEPSLTALPGLAFNAINSSLDWRYLTEPTEPHPTACLESGGVCAWPRGKMVSGTGGMYGMMYARGHPSVYDDWARQGNPGWSYKELEEYFDRAENPINPKFVTDRMFKNINTGGPMTIDNFSHKPEFADEILKAAAEMGYRTAGLHGEKQTGFMVAPMLTQDGLRGTTSRYYLRPVAGRSNLYVLTNAHVTKVLTEPWSKRATGIELIDNEGKKRKLMANKEVILTAGAIGSPQILLQSGIGPKEDLEELDIPVVKDLPVGRNLQNHVSIGIKMTIKDDYYETLSLDSVNEFVFNRSGPVASTGLTQVTAFLESSFATPGVPDIQIFFDGFSSSCVRTGLDIECPDGSIGTCPGRREIVARPTVVIARSRGYLTLRSKDPLDHPLIYPNYFTNETDIKILIEGIKKVVELTKTKTMKKWDMRLEMKPHPWCSRYHFCTDAYWECLIRAQTGPENHQSSTCRMAPEASGGVVDHELRVHGVPNLRVADASVFPVLTNANPVAPIVVVAEKAADMIVTHWKKVQQRVDGSARAF